MSETSTKPWRDKHRENLQSSPILRRKIYQLDDQKKPQSFAGQKVQVTGTLDNATKTIHVTDIKAAS
jgi:hypothetical protein